MDLRARRLFRNLYSTQAGRAAAGRRRCADFHRRDKIHPVMTMCWQEEHS
jgi:hypothetical protein